MAGLTKGAMGGFDADKAAALTIDAMSGLGADQMSGMSKGAMGGLTTDQFSALPPLALGGLKSENLGGLPADVFKSMTADDLANLDPAEVQGMPDIAKMVTNLPEFTDLDVVKGLLPVGWTIDSTTGDMTAPPGAEISFKQLKKAAVVLAGEPKVPALPNLDSSLTVGAGSGKPTVLTGMGDALAAAVPGTDLGFTQTTDGILNIGSKDGGPPVASFIPDASNMVQAPADAKPGVSQDPITGGYVVTTPDGFQIPLKPALSDPKAVAALIPNGKVEIGAGGQTSIEDFPGPDGTLISIAGIPSPLLTTDPRPPGIYTDGEEVTIVSAGGSAQKLSPAIKDPEALKVAAAAIPGVEGVIFKDDGTIALTVDGAAVKLKPSLKVEKAVPGAPIVPGFSVDPITGETFFTSKNGDKQKFKVVPPAAGV